MKGKKSKKTLGEKDLKDARIKKALGYDATEIIEEYVAGDEGEIKLSKRKVTKKNVPPDITAIKMLIEEGGKSVKEMSDEELNEEKQRLLNLLSEQN